MPIWLHNLLKHDKDVISILGGDYDIAYWIEKKIYDVLHAWSPLNLVCAF